MKVYHDHDKNDSWTEITDIISYPTINPRLDEIGTCIVIIRDFEGALYSTWKDYEFIPIKVEDDSSNILFRGYLTGKSFKHDQLTLTISGLGVILEWKSFTNNYVLEQGKVKTAPASDTLTLCDKDGGAYSWAADYWNSGDQDKGLLIVDNSRSTVSQTWDASAVAFNNEDSSGGNAASTQAKNDANFAWGKESTVTCNNDIELTIDGDSIGDTNFLQKIEIYYNFGQRHVVTEEYGAISGYVYLQIKKDTTWQTKKSFYKTTDFVADTTSWTDSPMITITDTHEELAKYFDKTGAYFTSLKGLRFLSNVYNTDYVGGNAGDFYNQVDYCIVVVYYNTQDISPVMEQISDSENSWVKCTDITNWANEGVSGESGEGVNDGDSFRIGENTAQILADLSSYIDLPIISNTTLTKYMARWFRGNNGLEVLTAICDLEGTHWWEDYINNRIVISKETDMVDSTVNLTQANYGWNWLYEDNCNNFYKIEVFGCASLGIYAYAEDTDVNSDMVKQIIDESILTNADAQEVANEQLAIWKVKRPSIILTLSGVNADLSVGKTVGLTMVRPTVDAADYPIRMIQRSKLGDGIKTVISCGLGKSPIQEKLANVIRNTAYLARKSHTDKLISTPFGEGAVITWSSIGGRTGGVEAIITTELEDGQSIDNSIDALILAHHDAASTDHDDRYFTETEINAFKLNKWASPDGDVAMANHHLSGLAQGTGAGDSVEFLQIADFIDDDGAVSAVATADDYVKNIGDAMTGELAMGTNKITGLGDPVANQDAATKAWVIALGTDLANYSAVNDLDMNQYKIIDLPAPVSDNDATRKIYVDDQIDLIVGGGLASDDLVFSNDTERTGGGSQSYSKVKEIMVYKTTKLRVYWEAKRTVTEWCTLAKSRVYINGVAQGSEHSNNSSNWVAFTEDVELQAGDALQIYAKAYYFTEPDNYTWRQSHVRYMRIKFIEYVSNDP